MSRYYSYLNSATKILSAYKGEEPFASFIKKHFAQHKKYGSKDRKHIAHLCYCYFRSGKALTNIPARNKILTGLFLCSNESNEILQELEPSWNEKISLPVQEKLSFLHNPFSIENIFPWKDELSAGIDHIQFCESFFVQPDLFLRLRPRKEDIVKKKLSEAEIDFKIISESCIALNNSTRIDSIVELDKEAVVQDYSSRRVGEFIKSEIQYQKSKISLWDCCSGSGGKSIMVHDINPEIELTVSDVRESILANLKKRFEKAGIKKYKSFIADLSSSRFTIHHSLFDFIIYDAPCTGSGTWSRTPEQLCFFQERKN